MLVQALHGCHLSSALLCVSLSSSVALLILSTDLANQITVDQSQLGMCRVGLDEEDMSPCRGTSRSRNVGADIFCPSIFWDIKPGQQYCCVKMQIYTVLFLSRMLRLKKTPFQTMLALRLGVVVNGNSISLEVTAHQPSI